MSNQAWVTLATNDSYSLGALVLAHSLRRAGSAFPAVVLITPSVTEAMRERLRAVFAEVVLVDVLDSGDAAHLALLQRPELGITFTKIHCWNLTQYEKCVFLDADTLVIQNCDELFEREELSAAPDVGWPDCFNSGVFVFKPSAETFSNLIRFAAERGSFDGGDQGLLNSYFSDWAHDDIKKHLPFIYNVTSAAFYSYIPALKHYGQNLKIIHFIGAIKPWLQQFNWQSRTVEAPEHLRSFLQLWWDLFVADVHTQLDTAMTGVAGNLARVVPGAPLQREAVDELTRRQGWEAGNIDYMGADSFDNIWAKISQTLSQPPANQTEQSSDSQSVSAPQQISEPIAVGTKMDVVEAVVEHESVLPTLEKEELAPTTEKKDIKVASVESEVPKVAKTEACKLIESKVPKPVESEVPKRLESEVPKSAEVVASEPAVSIPEKVSTPEGPEKIKVTAPVSEAAEVSSKTKDPIPIPAEIAAEIPAAVDVTVPVETSSPSNEKDKPVQPDIPITALEDLKVDEPLTEAPVPASVVEQLPVAESKTAPATDVPFTPAAEPKPVVEPSVKPATPEKSSTKPEVGSDSPPLVHTPSKDNVPVAPAAKSTEEGAEETRL